MLSLTEYFIYLWLLPVIIFIIFPLILSFLWLLKYCLKETAAGRIPFVKTFLESYFTAEHGLQQRQEKRLPPQEKIEVEVADGAIYSKGVVTNFSQHGLCISGLSTLALASCSKLLVTVNDKASQFQFEAKPCWSRRNKLSAGTIGLFIQQPSPAWISYIPRS